MSGGCVAEAVYPMYYMAGTQIRCYLADDHSGDHYDQFYSIRWSAISDSERNRATIAARKALEYALEAGTEYK